MSEKAFDRAFNKVLLNQNLAEDKARSQAPLSEAQKQAKETEALRNETVPMSVQDAIKRMLLAEKDKDWFRLMALPAPYMDALNRPAWDGTPSDVSKAYRKLSALVHPDKNPQADARLAFEALNKAHRALRDPGTLESILSEHAEAARRRQEAAEAAATPDEKVLLYAAKKNQAEQLRKEGAKKYMDEVLQQRQRLQERAKRKREVELRAQKREEERESSDEEPELEVKKHAKPSSTAKRKGKPKLIF